MFGESDSESPRVPSPWDSLAPSPRQIPKLVPEAEEGNVEYKLQLLSPSPARFARLVTQLKWRLLEGGGQAYYELGVADAGTLVGLPRQQLEESLETLEMMAGEIGASVIVVKEIEVPPELSSLAESQLERWGGKSSTSRKDLLRMKQHDDESSATEELDVTDAEESDFPPPSSPVSVRFGPSTTFDLALASFAADVEEDVASYADSETLDDDPPSDCVAGLSVSLEITSVYKPRPMKKRATHIQFEYAKKRRRSNHPSSKSTDTTHPSTNPVVQDSLPGGTKPRHRKDKRDKRPETKLDTLPSDAPVPSGELIDSIHHQSSSADDPNIFVPDSPHVDPPPPDASGITPKEPRLIVEALVVRKMSVDEAYLDFEGFSLQ